MKKGKLVLLLFIFAGLTRLSAHPFQAADTLRIVGRWDLIVNVDGKEKPSWLEVWKSGDRALVGRFVSMGGSERPISRMNVNGNNFNFEIPPQWEKGSGNLKLEGSHNDKGISGSIIYPNGKNYSWTGVKAPSLRTDKKVTWGKAIPLIQSNSVKGWHADAEKNQWVVENGILKSPAKGANLITDEKYNDFKLHVEFRCPKGGNSGVYLRGRYEVQITDSKDKEPASIYLGGVYGFVSPSEQVAKGPDEWQSMDITLIGRMITVVANGKQIITNQEIPGITGGAIDSKEGEPGPIMLQGDHEPIEFRNMVITPAN
jgi:hypothetical protein